jgi:light-regulated signal transduction histidine kinase (bacteriophytochrome)
VGLKFRTFRNAIDQYKVAGTNEETKKKHLLKGKTTMDSIRFHVAAIGGIEAIQMQERERMKARHDAVAPFYAFLLIIALLALLTFFYDKTIKQLGRSKRLLYKLKLLNGKLKQKNHALELYNKELDSFTYIASHDLKEPLRKISLYSVMLEETELEKFSDASKLHFQKIQHATKRMQQLLDDLLLYSHATKTSLELQRVDLNTIVKVVEENLAEDLDETKAHVQLGPLPVIHGLPFQLKQLFENLMMNSLKYRQENVAPRIEIESVIIRKSDIKHRFFKRSNLYHKIIFRDNGSGFEQSYAEKVFQLFQRVHLNGKQLGSGIGLTICKKIVQNHNGFIKATSEINIGTVFEIYFPYDTGKQVAATTSLANSA